MSHRKVSDMSHRKVSNMPEVKNNPEKKPYEKPVFIEETEMNFPEEIWEEFNGGNWCFGCSNCNCN